MHACILTISPHACVTICSQLLPWVFNNDGLSAPMNLAEDLLAAATNSYQKLMSYEIPPGSLNGPLGSMLDNIRAKYGK